MEEKERKKIARRLPKVESDLQQLIQRSVNRGGADTSCSCFDPSKCVDNYLKVIRYSFE